MNKKGPAMAMGRFTVMLAANLAAFIVAGPISAEETNKATSVLEAVRKAAVFDLEFVNTSLEPEKPEERVRLARISDLLRQKLSEASGYQVVSIAPLRDQIATGQALYKCNDCDVDYARELGADLAVTGTVQKISNLILNINVYIKDTANARLVKVASVDIRGNTDESWIRGMGFLIRNRLLVRQ